MRLNNKYTHVNAPSNNPQVLDSIFYSSLLNNMITFFLPLNGYPCIFPQSGFAYSLFNNHSTGISIDNFFRKRSKTVSHYNYTYSFATFFAALSILIRLYSRSAKSARCHDLILFNTLLLFSVKSTICSCR